MLTTSASVRDARIQWAAAALVETIERARLAGWLPGEPRGTVPVVLLDTSETAPADRLRDRLGLSAAQYDALWLLAAIELDPHVTQLARVLMTGSTDGTTLQILHTVMHGLGHRGLSANELDQLVALGLVELTTRIDAPLYQRTVRATDRFIDVAGGDDGIDRELTAFATVRCLDADSLRAVEVPASLQRVFDGARSPLVVAVGGEGSGRATLLSRVAAQGAGSMIRVQASSLARDVAALTRQLRVIARECRLVRAVPMIEDVDVLVGAEGDETRLELVLAMLDAACPGPVFVTANQTRRWPDGRPVISHDVGTPSPVARAAVWREALPGVENAIIEDIATRYAVGPGAILAAAETARLEAGDGPITGEHVQRGVRTHVEHRLAGLATRIEITQTWNDVVMPADDFEQIVDVIARARQHTKVLEQWGFGAKIGRGHGLCALLSGPPGTGKTMVAGLIAKDLELDLYQVDLSKLVSKYIGETEKQLARVFDAAEVGHAVLLFDEADSLFAKRSEVKSSNDRYANLEVNYLLQRIEQFKGIVLLTSNHESAIDDAFRRRLAAHVRFPMPEGKEREQIWRAIIPDRAEVADAIDFQRLAADFTMSGGHIKNSVVRAAYIAADRGEPIGMEHLWHAARLEYEAMGRLVQI